MGGQNGPRPPFRPSPSDRATPTCSSSLTYPPVYTHGRVGTYPPVCTHRGVGTGPLGVHSQGVRDPGTEEDAVRMRVSRA
mmetsp:Transcript_97592/g.168296  ORF Transcript_97592/g.168296 Transcript_97592/m.168296 type:complete len:80 (+) Transcript_97592:85-324(+)